MIGLSRIFVVLVTVPTLEFVVRVARVDSHMYDIDTPADQCLSMLYVKPALMTGANELLNRAVVEPSSRVLVEGEYRNAPLDTAELSLMPLYQT